ncbi:MAG: GNAT family N-acetyltransferase [Candidatus Bipolaricaulota bacterium]|nr:GNAT family N-acetyltransferase [Candidatus Bipolaricaulota bacterium]
MIQLIEERAMDAWPALEVLVSASRSLDGKIEEAERLYRARSLATTFKMRSESRPDGLDAALAERGYVEEARTSVQVADLARGQEGTVHWETSWNKSGPWRDAFHRVGDVPAQRRALHDQILASISLPSAFASAEQDGRIVGCALGVVQDGWLGIFDVVVDGDARRRGHGERLMRGLMAWGQDAGARKAYLQVMLQNAPALALYNRLGFQEAYPYWYRVKR